MRVRLRDISVGSSGILLYNLGRGNQQGIFMLQCFRLMVSFQSDIGGNMSASENKITVVFADDQILAHEGIRKVLEQAADISLAGMARDGIEAKKLVAKLRPNILLLDISMPGPCPVEIEEWVRENYPDTITLVLADQDQDACLAQMMDAGATGYLTKDTVKEKLITAIRLAAKGVCLFDEQQLSRAQCWRDDIGKKMESLTNREREILCLAAEGRANKEIAHTFKVTLRTVEKHLGNIYEKLGVKSKIEAVLWWVKHGSDFTN
jgi:two-component system response regulator NreC